MMAAISNSAILDSAISTKKTSLMHSHSNWWWQPSWILLSWIQPICTKKFTCSFWLNLMIWQPSWNLPSWIQLFHKKTSLMHSHSTSWWQHLEICHHGFSHFAQKNFTHSFSLNLMMAAILNFAIMDLAILHKKTSLMHSHSTWWWQSSWILPSWIQPSCTKKFTCSFWLNLMIAAIVNSAMLDSLTVIFSAILDSEFGHLWFSHLSFSSQTHSHFPTICTKKTFTHCSMLSSLRLTQKQSPSTLTQTNSIWLT